MSSFAYLFERFPSFTQTFCTREVVEMARQKMEPAVFSIRAADELAPALPPEISVQYLPPEVTLVAQIKQLREGKKLPRAMRRTLGRWSAKGDKNRVYAAAWLGPILRRAGIRHVHAHFAGIAARTAFWLKKFYGISYSFTGHANDIFVETDFPVSLSDLVREARLVVTETDFAQNWLREKFPRAAKKIHRVYNGIEVEKFALSHESRDDSCDNSRENFRDENEPPRIVSVGRLIEKKGFGALIDACAILQKNGVAFLCHIVGSGPLENELRAQIKRLGLSEKVILEGARSESEIMDFLRSARIFALACTREKDGGMDNLPTVIMEAMACALPVVSTRLAGVPEMVIDGETGRLVAENDVAALSQMLNELLNDRKLALSFGKNGRRRAEEFFSTQNTTRALKLLLARYGRVFPPRVALETDRALFGEVARRLISFG